MSEKTEKAVLAATVDVAGPRFEVPVAGWNQFAQDAAEKMREQFEAAYEAMSYALNGRFDRAVFTRGGDGDYVIHSVQSAWWAWQSSRKAVVVELPICETPVSVAGIKVLSLPAEGRNAAIGECRAAIEAQGLAVKP